MWMDRIKRWDMKWMDEMKSQFDFWEVFRFNKSRQGVSQTCEGDTCHMRTNLDCDLCEQDKGLGLNG